MFYLYTRGYRIVMWCASCVILWWSLIKKIPNHPRLFRNVLSVCVLNCIRTTNTRCSNKIYLTNINKLRLCFIISNQQRIQRLKRLYIPIYSMTFICFTSFFFYFYFYELMFLKMYNNIYYKNNSTNLYV